MSCVSDPPRATLKSPAWRPLHETRVNVLCVADIRPKMYPRIEYEKARTFTPREVEEWNQRQYKGAAQQAKQQ